MGAGTGGYGRGLGYRCRREYLTPDFPGEAPVAEPSKGPRPVAELRYFDLPYQNRWRSKITRAIGASLLEFGDHPRNRAPFILSLYNQRQGF